MSPTVVLKLAETRPRALAREGTFYWLAGGHGSFATKAGPNLGLLGKVLPANIDFVRLAVTAMAADRTVPRKVGRDDWTQRYLHIKVPVEDPVLWSSIAAELEALMGFLTGDIWKLSSMRTGGIDQAILLRVHPTPLTA